MWFFTGRASLDWLFVNGIALKQSIGRGLGTNSFFVQHTKNYDKHPTSLWKTPACTTQTWCTMCSQDCRRPWIRRNPQQRTWQTFQNLLIMWQTRCKAPINSWPHNYRGCRKCRCNILQNHGMHTKIMEDMDTMADTTIIVAEWGAVRNAEEIGVVDETVGVTVILQTTVGLTQCVLIRANNAGHRQKTTRNTWCGATRCRGASRTAPGRSVWYLQVSLM